MNSPSAIYLQFSDCGRHIRKWSWEWFDGCTPYDPRAAIVSEMGQWARNMERYPFKSATMAEAGLMAANAMRSVARELVKESAGIERDAPDVQSDGVEPLHVAD